VVSVVKIWEFNVGPDAYWQERRNEGQIFLRNLFHWQRGWSRECAIEINHSQRRLGGKDSAFGDNLVAFRLDWCGVRFRKFYASLDGRLRQS